MIHLYSASELLDWIEPPWLITDHFHEKELVLLYGPPGSGKSFLALDWGLHIASGLPWLDRFPVAHGPVLYLAGEGAASLQKRLAAWCSAHQVSAHRLGAYFQCRSLSLRNPDTLTQLQQAFIDTPILDEYREPIEAGIEPSLIIVDTLSQFFGGGDENGSDMTQFVDNLRNLGQSLEWSCTILILHHTNKSGLSERGHTSLRGNIDTAFRCDAVLEDHKLVGLTLKNDKQRDSAHVAPLVLRTVSHEKSLVLQAAPIGSPKVEAVYQLVKDHPGLREAALIELAETHAVCSRRTVQSAIDYWVKIGKIVEQNHQFWSHDAVKLV